MIRRVLVAMDDSPHGDAAAALGLQWARRFGAQVLGLGVLDEPGITRPESVPLGATAYKHHRDAVRLADAHQRIVGFLGAFARRCAEADVHCAIVENVGRPHEQIIQEAEACDLFSTSVTRAVLKETPVPVVAGA